ncbi:MAG: type II toxin-antitoxin system RelE/ParE family toxin [Pseudomonadales bacterium]|jgi:hypothetical protein|nr:type II toxin-antitoxin system RelE/ParE family toxin [Pseudomonadales bacterium]
MTTRQRTVRITANFERSLERIQAFLLELEAPPEAFDALLDYLCDTVVPNLERFPELGLEFLKHRPSSLEAHDRIAALRTRFGTGLALREYIARDYLILYVVGDETLDLLAIKHHSQLSFDLKDHWPP